MSKGTILVLGAIGVWALLAIVLANALQATAVIAGGAIGYGVPAAIRWAGAKWRARH